MIFKSLLFAMLFAPIPAMGQSAIWRVSVEAGPSLSTLRGVDFSQFGMQYKPLRSYTAGTGIQYNINKYFSVRSGLIYQRVGNRIGGDVYITAPTEQRFAKAKNIYHFFSVPLLGQASIGTKVKYSIFAGPVISYLAARTEELDIQDYYYHKVNSTKGYKRENLSVQCGLGLMVPLGKKIFGGIEVSNTLGLYDISELPMLNDGSIRTNVTAAVWRFMYML